MQRVRQTVLLLLAFLLMISAGACAPAEADPAGEMLSYLAEREYARIYKILDPESLNGLTLAAMSDRYNAVYETLGITSVTSRVIQRTDISEAERRVSVLLIYQSDKLGELNMGNELHMVRKNGEWKLTWDESLIFPGLESGDSLQLNIIAAQRGEIFDKNGEILAANDHAVTVYAQSEEVHDPDTLARLAAPLLEMTETEILEHIDPDRFVEEEERDSAEEEEPAAPEEEIVIKRSIALKVFPKNGLDDELRTQLEEIPGIHVDTSGMTPIRYYPYGAFLSHTLGYTSVITAEDKENEKYAKLANGTFIGRSGLEAAFDDDLRGVAGYELAIYGADGTKKKILASTPAVDGSDLRLSIDLSMEQTVETLLLENLTAEMSGAVVVLDPVTGAVDAQASFPTFDPNLFSYPVSEEDWAFFMDENNRLPLYNRITLGLYPPGSTLKPFVGAAGLTTGAITLNFAMSQARIKDNTWQPNDSRWVYPPIRRVSSTPDPLNLYNAIVNSDNIFFAYTALTIGGDGLRQALTNIGFGDSDYDFDLPVSTSRISNESTFSSQKLLADTGYGQGEVLITPIQMAATFGALANNGTIMSPYIVSSVKRTEGRAYTTVRETAPTVYRDRVIPADIVAELQPMLRGVVTDGTGAPIDINGMNIHAKTGTAQLDSDNGREIAWLIGYNGEGTMRRLVCVMVEVPADQGSVRNSIARGIFEAINSGLFTAEE